MKWKYIKGYVKLFPKYFAGCFATGITFVASFGDSMIGYYCALGTSPFIGFDFTASRFCSLQVAFVFIMILTLALMIALFNGALIFDIGLIAASSLKKESIKPRIRHRFVLSNEKNLYLKVWIPRLSKPAKVEFYFKQLENNKGRKIGNHPELISTWSREYKHGNIIGILNPGQAVEFPVGIYIGESFSLRSSIAWVHNYPDGMYKFTIGCKGQYKDIDFNHLDFSVWLEISNNKLVKINDRPK